MRGRIRRRSKSSWELTIDLGRDARGRRQRKFVSVRGKKADAERKLRELLTTLDGGVPIHTSHLMLNDYLERWLEFHSTRVRQRTIYGYGLIIRRYITPRLGSIPLTKLQPGHAEQIYTSMIAKGLSPRTVIQTHRVLKKALKQAVRWNMIGRNPLDLVDPPTAEQKEMITLDVDQLLQLLDRAMEGRYGAAIYTSAYTGLRRGELVGLQWPDIDLERKVISVRREVVFVPRTGYVISQPKSAKSRRAVDVASAVVEVLQRHRAAQAEHRLRLGSAFKNEEWVFCKDDGSHLSPTTLTRAFAAIRDELGLPPVRLHDLRHTHASLLLQAGVHLKVVQERLGHSTIAVTADTYSHVAAGLQRAAAEAFDQVMDGSL